VIGEAIDVLMARYKITEAAVWQAIVRTSRDREIQVRRPKNHRGSSASPM
jgi:hypothetical protein